MLTALLRSDLSLGLLGFCSPAMTRVPLREDPFAVVYLQRGNSIVQAGIWCASELCGYDEKAF